MTEKNPPRAIRSFVRRQGRLTAGQQRAINDLWSQFAIDHTDNLIDLNQLFGRSAPKMLEIGFGNGASLAAMAKAQPDHDFLGVEVHKPGVGQLLKAIDQEKLTNLRVACHDAVELLKYQIQDNSLDRVQLFFPDPWHKKRHHKRRLIQAEFIALLAPKIKPAGHIHIATDWLPYAEHILAELSASNHFSNCSDSSTYIARPSYRPLTKFEQRGQRLGHGIWDLLFKRS